MSGQAPPSNVGANISTIDTFQPPKVVEDAIAAARKAIEASFNDTTTNGLRPDHCIRIAFYDALSYNPLTKEGGPHGSIRIWEGLDEATKSTIAKLDYLKIQGSANVWWAPYVSYADLYQLAGIVAVERASGPSIKFQYGRMDCIPLHSSKLQIIKEDTKADDVKATFHRIGFTDKEIVALSAAYYYWMNYPPSYGGEQPKINASYYEKLLKEPEATKSEASNPTNTSIATPSRTNTTTTPTLRYWKCLLSDASFHKHVELFAKDPKAFENEYVGAHKKLSELGFKHFPEPIFTAAEHHDIKHGVAFAVAMTILFGFVGFFYEAMRN